MGFAGVVWYGGIRVAGMSGIFDKKHYRLGHYESPPYSADTLRRWGVCELLDDNT
jgi:lariat debranching enzyme